MGRFGNNARRNALVILLVVILGIGVAQAVYIDVFNKTVHTVAGADETQESYLKFNDRDDSTSTWMKRDFDLYGKTVDLMAQTVDGTFYNNSNDTVASWVLRLNIEGDCLINNAWCGTVEIHQFVGTDREAVQTLDLRSYDIGSVELTHLYDGDLLIPLEKGDYIVYYPSEKDGELPIAPHTELTMGTIFYYLEDLDLSNFELDYNYQRDFTNGIGFIALVALSVLWLFLLVGHVVANFSYKRAVKDMELRKSGIASMSSIYSIISFIDLQNDEIIPVFADSKTKGKIPEGPRAREKLLEIFGRDTADQYREVVLEFVDTSTLAQRLERESIACEYVSKSYGWSQVRFFAAEREEGKPLSRVLLTIQDINDEKRELGIFKERATQAELENKARNAFVAGMSNSMLPPIRAIFDFNEKILEESNEETSRAYAKQIKVRARLLANMIDGAIDSARIVAGGAKSAAEEYSLEALLADVCDIATAMMEDDALAFETDIAPALPDRLIGNAVGIERALIGLFAYATEQTDSGTVKLSIYGKEAEGSVHLLFSVHVSGFGMTESEMEEFARFATTMEAGDFSFGGAIEELEVVTMQLSFIDSKLQVVNEPGEECELYFEVEQGMVSPALAAGEVVGDVAR